MIRIVVAVLLSGLFASSSTAGADEGGRIAEARQRFLEGAELVRRAQWPEALVAFDASAKLRPHVVTLYNIAACQRALGHFTQSLRTLRSAIEPQGAEAGRLPDTLREEANALATELDRLLVRVHVTMQPADAAISVDGRPLEQAPAPAPELTLVAGVATPGPGAIPPAARFLLVMDPGLHVLVFSRKGYTDVVVNRTFVPAMKADLPLELDRLPATLHIVANTDHTAVSLDRVDVGSSPVTLSRPAGTYEIAVRKSGFEPYRTSLTVGPGEESNVRVNLSVKKQSVIRKWWFWTAIGAAATLAATGTYLGVRASETPQLDGGGLGWVVRVR